MSLIYSIFSQRNLPSYVFFNFLMCFSLYASCKQQNIFFPRSKWHKDWKKTVLIVTCLQTFGSSRTFWDVKHVATDPDLKRLFYSPVRQDTIKPGDQQITWPDQTVCDLRRCCHLERGGAPGVFDNIFPIAFSGDRRDGSDRSMLSHMISEPSDLLLERSSAHQQQGGSTPHPSPREG